MKMDEKFTYPYDPERHGPHYSQKTCAIFAARLVLENRDEFSDWLRDRGIDPADTLAWAARTEALHQAAVRGLRDWPGGLLDPMRRT
jgi:hypothetical protein